MADSRRLRPAQQPGARQRQSGHRLGFLALCLLLLAGPGAASSEGTGENPPNSAPGLVVVPLPASPERTLYSVVRDQQGFLWLGSADGIMRFDGRRYTRIGIEAGASRHGRLSSLNSGNLLIDDQNRLWIGTWGGGLNRLDLPDGRVVQYPVSDEHPSALQASRVQRPYQSRDGQIWIGSADNGLFRYDENRQQFEHVAGSAGLRIWDFAEGPDGQLWVATEDGLGQLDPVSLDWQFLSAAGGNPYGFDHPQLRAIHADASGRLWLATRLGLGQFDPATRRFTRLQGSHAPPNLIINRIQAAGDNRLWLATAAGLMLLDTDSGQALPLAGESERRLLPAWDVRDLLVDDDSLWLATRYNGLQRLRLGTIDYQRLESQLAELAQLAQPPTVTALNRGEQRVWVGTDRGLFQVNADGELAMVNREIGPIQLIETSPSGLWLTTNERLLHWNPASGEQRDLTNALEQHQVVPINISSLRVDDGGRLWMAAANSPLLALSPDATEITRHPDPDGRIGTRNSQLNQIAIDSLGRLWISSFTGELYLFDPSQNQWTRFNGQGTIASGADFRIYRVVVQDDERHWLASNDGLYRLDPLEGRFERTALQAGRQPILWDGLMGANGLLWLASSDGLIAFDSVSGSHARHALAGDGQERAEWRQLVQLPGDDAALLAAGRTGLVRIQPSRPPVRRAPVLELVGLRIDNEPLQFHPPGQIIRLPADYQLLNLELATPRHAPEDPLSIRYRIGDSPTGWQAAEQAERIQLGRLPHGRHQLEIQAASDYGTWSAPLMLALQVTPPAYRDWRRVGPAVLLFLLALFALHRLRVRRLEQQRRQLEEEVKARTAELTAQQGQLMMAEKMAALGMLTAGVAHEINNPVAFSHAAGQNLKADLETFSAFLHELAGPDADPKILAALNERIGTLSGHVDISLEGTSRIHEMVRDLRVFSRLDEAERKTVDLADSLRATLKLVASRYQDSIEFRSLIHGDCQLLCWPAQINQVFMNLIVNACQALEHSQRPGGKRVSVELAGRADHIAVSICDNGDGMAAEQAARIFEPLYTTKPAEQGTGLGLSITQRIVERHGGTIQLDNRPGEGCCFLLTLPRQPDADQTSAG
ncbi:MAG: sensor histidine kinase [Wenzhouxiangella sp.]